MPLLLANQAEKISKSVGDTTGSSLLGNIAANVAATVGGVLVGGSAGGAMASNVQLYNTDISTVDRTISYEVKNYNIENNSSGLINNVANQAIQRAANLPEGMQQQVVIDIRGQTVSPAQRTAIVQGIVQKSNGIISPINIQFKTK